MQTRDVNSALPRVSVLMPTFNQAAFLRRALNSLRAQTFTDWDLIVINDGATDTTHAMLASYLRDPHVHYHRSDENHGLGAALNDALKRAVAPLVAYLPSDDVWYAEHLASLVGLLDAHPGAMLAFSGVRHHYNQSAAGQIEGFPLQLVQVMHRRTQERWIERTELVTDDLERMFWAKLRSHGIFVGTGLPTCEWVDHPAQMHKAVRESTGGINPYRLRYQVHHPLRFHSSESDLIDEVARYRRFRERPDTPLAADGLKILLVGELAFNPERVLALEERGHKLYGLWTADGHWFNTVGPLPFGHVEDLPRTSWREAVQDVQPDVIYALLNWQAVPFAHHVLMNNPDVPFVWHFKEGPFFCLEKGTWDQLVDLHTRSDGQIYASPELRDWFATVLPGELDPEHALVLDGDLPKREWFTDDRRPRLSETDGEMHTIVSGRPYGFEPETLRVLAQAGVHTHFYGLIRGKFGQQQWQGWLDAARRLAPRHVHLHPTVHQEDWVAELSQYDAGWLHLFKSENGGELRRANWDDLNYPARISTLVAAGLPLLHPDNRGAVVATQALAGRLDIGVPFSELAQVGAQLRDEARMAAVRDNVWRQRELFTFDAHADRLIAFFRDVIASRESRT